MYEQPNTFGVVKKLVASPRRHRVRKVPAQVRYPAYFGPRPWDMEHPFDTDLRTKLVQRRMVLDIGFRLKRHARDQSYFVELKQADDYRMCIDRMCMDANKVFSARRASFDGLNIRYVACAGVFRVADEKEVSAYLDEATDWAKIDVDGFYYEKLSEGYKLLIFNLQSDQFASQSAQLLP